MNQLSSSMRASRKIIQINVELDFGKSIHRAHTTNISETGVAIISDKAVHHDVGTKCQMSWRVENTPVAINCEVVRVYSNKMALAFENREDFGLLLEAV